MWARDNPFATAHLHRIRYRFDGLTWDQFLERLAQARYRGAIVGPEGAGKSTLLEDLQPKLTERGFAPLPLRLTEEAPRFPRAMLRKLEATLTRRHIVLLDGAEQMSSWAWWGFRKCVRRAGGLVITAHRSGLLPTVLACGTTPKLLAEVAGKLLGDDDALPRAEIERLYLRHSGNIREALRELYDTCGGQSHGDGTATHRSGLTAAVPIG
jgi:GTPase SAR1 family protein